MNITEVRIRQVDNEGKLRAVASVTFDNQFVVHDIKIIDGINGTFVAMPSRKMSEGDFRDIAHPIVQEMRDRLKKAVMNAYAREMRKTISDAIVPKVTS